MKTLDLTPETAGSGPAHLFANLIAKKDVADELTGAALVMLAAAPVALFWWLLWAAPASPACTQITTVADIAAN